jgi:two-component system cell cycle response regulator DivK
VLIVEDHPETREIYRSYLKHLGYGVIEATDGDMAMEMARAETPDVIVMDMSLPKLSGWTATERLKGDPDTQDIPVVAFTANVLLQDRRRALEVGCDGFVAKPVHPMAVVEEIRRVLGR